MTWFWIKKMYCEIRIGHFVYIFAYFKREFITNLVKSKLELTDGHFIY